MSQTSPVSESEPVAWQFRQRSGVGKGPQSQAPWCDWCSIEREDYEMYIRAPNPLIQVRPLYAGHAQAAPEPLQHFDAHPHWKPGDDQFDRHPKTLEEWDSRKDPVGQHFARAIRRLQMAMDRDDPRAPDQMALVLRWDISSLMHDWIHKNAVFEIWRDERAKKSADAALSVSSTDRGGEPFDTVTKCRERPHGHCRTEAACNSVGRCYYADTSTTQKSDFEQVFQDACDEAGCEYDNEALLQSIANLTGYPDMLWEWFRERRGNEDMRANASQGGLSADDFKQMLDEHESNLLDALASPPAVSVTSPVKTKGV